MKKVNRVSDRLADFTTFTLHFVMQPGIILSLACLSVFEVVSLSLSLCACVCRSLVVAAVSSSSCDEALLLFRAPSDVIFCVCCEDLQHTHTRMNLWRTLTSCSCGSALFCQVSSSVKAREGVRVHL